MIRFNKVAMTRLLFVFLLGLLGLLVGQMAFASSGPGENGSTNTGTPSDVNVQGMTDDTLLRSSSTTGFSGYSELDWSGGSQPNLDSFVKTPRQAGARQG